MAVLATRSGAMSTEEDSSTQTGAGESASQHAATSIGGEAGVLPTDVVGAMSTEDDGGTKAGAGNAVTLAADGGGGSAQADTGGVMPAAVDKDGKVRPHAGKYWCAMPPRGCFPNYSPARVRARGRMATEKKEPSAHLERI